MELNEMKKGQEYIRIIPDKNDWTFTHNVAVFDGISENGKMLVHFRDETVFTKTCGNKPREISFTAGWVPANSIFDGPKSDLSKYEGRQIKQIKPVLLHSGIKHVPLRSKNHPFDKPYMLIRTDKDYYDESYMGKKVKLISATKYHIIIDDDGIQKILDSRYVSPEIWTLAE